jgi:hypothetical protein
MSGGLIIDFGDISVMHMFMAFACGIMGAAAGGFPSFVVIGFLISIGSGVAAATGGDMSYMMNVAFGYGFGPIAFAGGAAAVGYAGMKGYVEDGTDVVTPLLGLQKPDVLIVGGIFGCVTAASMYLFLSVIPFTIGGVFWTDGLAVSIAPVLIIVRLVFGKTGVFGKVEPGDSRFGLGEVAMTSAENAPAPKVWVPWQTRPAELALIGFAAGTGSAGLCLLMPNGGLFMGFGIALMLLTFMLGGYKVPVAHHICVISACAAFYSGSIIWGSIFGILAAFTAEFMSKVFLVHADTYIDPPMYTIFSLTTVILILNALGLFSTVLLP